MSHVVSCKLEIKSLTALKKACERLGLTFNENKKNWRWYGTWVNDYSANDAAYKNGVPASKYGTSDSGVISIVGNNTAYEAGLYRNNDDTYSLAYDFYGGQGAELQRVLGKNAENLENAYAIEAVREQAQEFVDAHAGEGWFIEEEQKKDETFIYVRQIEY